MDHVAQELAEAHAAKPIQWPASRDVGRQEDMGQGHLRVLLGSDNDVCVEVWNGRNSACVEFCNPGGNGGGRSGRTQAALIDLMRAIEADNAASPAVAWPLIVEDYDGTPMAGSNPNPPECDPRC